MKTQIFPLNQLSAFQLTEIVNALKNGAVLAVATDTVYGVACDAFNVAARQRIYALKHRPDTVPLQILIDGIDTAKQLVQWDKRMEQLGRACWPGPLTIISRATVRGQTLLNGSKGLGLRMPNHAGLLKLLAAFQAPLACTSANVHGSPTITKETDLCAFCQGKVEYILTDGTLSPVASSVIDITGVPTLLREGSLSRQALEGILKEPLK